MKEFFEKKLIDKKAIGAGTLLAPLPVVLVSCGDRDENNILTIAWVGIVNSKPPMLSISVRPERYSYDMLHKTNKFIVNLVDKNMVKAVDWCGVKSGRNHDKWTESGLTREDVLPDFPPAVKESPLALCCEVKQILSLGSHDCFIGEIIEVFAREDLLTKDASLNINNADLAVYAHGNYYGINDWRGFFGYSLAGKDVIAKRKLRILGDKSVKSHKNRKNSQSVKAIKNKRNNLNNKNKDERKKADNAHKNKQ